MSEAKARYGMEANEVRTFLSQSMLPDWLDLVLDFEGSRGSKLRDAVTGRDFVDLFGFFGSAPLGMNHPWMQRPEVERDLSEVVAVKPSNSDVVSLPMARFVERFTAEAVPAELLHLFLISGGALAVENAMKAAFDWKTRHNAEHGRPIRGQRILHFREAFHGRSGYTLSVTNTDPVKIRYFPKFDWPRITNPKIVFPLEGENLRRVEEAERLAEAQMLEAFERYPHEIAAILIEPIQGEGGDNHFRPQFFETLRRLADENDALLVYDEVQTGFGTTGHWWAYERHGVAPDILCFGKKAQICGVLASRRLEDVKNNVFALSSRINSTWGGNLVDMVRCGHVIDAIVELGLLDNITARGEQALSKLRQLEAHYGDLISQVRGVGGMLAFDLPETEVRNRLRQLAFEEGLLALPCGTRTLRFRPALSITAEEMDEGLECLARALSRV